MGARSGLTGIIAGAVLGISALYSLGTFEDHGRRAITADDFVRQRNREIEVVERSIPRARNPHEEQLMRNQIQEIRARYDRIVQQNASGEYFLIVNPYIRSPYEYVMPAGLGIASLVFFAYGVSSLMARRES